MAAGNLETHTPFGVNRDNPSQNKGSGSFSGREILLRNENVFMAAGLISGDRNPVACSERFQNKSS